jgi:hypothetical protein
MILSYDTNIKLECVCRESIGKWPRLACGYYNKKMLGGVVIEKEGF